MIVVSACLLGANCKYNGGNNYCEKLASFLDGKKVLCLCPEVEGGLPVPRNPVEIRGGRVVDKFATDYTQNFRDGAEKCLRKIDEYLRENPGESIEFAVLQARSPSCGHARIYDGTFSKVLVDGNGIFAGELIRRGVRCLTVEELGL
ncbi:MAG: DUF523 domain-containing protein [Spirochaetales bacterium]|nr:DUF523 domain-containing protein [Spirochaetales bacterium]